MEAYKRKIGLIDLNGISEILEKYDVGKETLADIAGFGKVTIKRYYDGFIPSKEYSDMLLKILSDETFFMKLVEENKGKLKDVAYRKVMSRFERLMEIGCSKIDQIANYIITHMGEVTPLALEKLLAFSNGVNYALNGNQLIDEECLLHYIFAVSMFTELILICLLLFSAKVFTILIKGSLFLTNKGIDMLLLK